MAYNTVYNFVEKHGFDTLAWVEEQLNRGQSHEYIASALHLSRARVTQIIEILFRKVYVPSELTKTYFENRELSSEARALHEKEIIKRQVAMAEGLHFIPGGKLDGQSTDRNKAVVIED